MEKFLELFKGFLATQLNYIPALCIIFALYYGILKKDPSMWKLALLALLPFGFYLIRRFVKNIIGFFAILFAMPRRFGCRPFLLPTPTEFVVL